MKKNFVLTGLLLIMVLGCTSEQPPAPPSSPVSQQPPVQQKPVVPVSPQPETAEPAVEFQNTYVYNPEGRRDPFKSILLTAVNKRTEFLPPLQQRELAELKLIAIIWGGLGQRAMLQTPDGKGYTVRVGTRVGANNGVVKKITANEVIVEERYTDLFGERKSREIVLKLEPPGERTE